MAFDAPTSRPAITVHDDGQTRATLIIEGVTVPAHRCASGALVPILDPEFKFAIEMSRIDREVREGFARLAVSA